jgi:hypothetical protein
MVADPGPDLQAVPVRARAAPRALTSPARVPEGPGQGPEATEGTGRLMAAGAEVAASGSVAAERETHNLVAVVVATAAGATTPVAPRMS